MLTVIVYSHRVVERLLRQMVLRILHRFLCNLRVWDLDICGRIVCWFPGTDVLQERGLGVELMTIQTF